MLSQRSAVASRSRRRPLLIGLGLILVAGVFAANLLLPTYLNRVPDSGPAPVPASGNTTAVVVTRTALPLGTPLSAQNLTVVNYPANLVPTGAYSAISQAAGHYLDLSVPANTPIVAALTVTEAGTAGAAALVAPPLDLSSGDKAISVPYDPVNDGGGFIHRNDHIDILDNQGTYVMTNIRVVRVVTNGNSGSLLLEVTPDGAQTLTKLLSNGTALRYVLRAASDYGGGGGGA